MADAKVEIQISAKDSASSVFKKVGGAAADLGKGLAVGLAAGGAAIAAGIGASVKVAADFEKQMSAVKAVSGATAQEMAQLSGKALQLGKDTSFSAMEAARGLEELVKGGVPIADIMNGAAEATLALAEAGGVDLATAAEISAAAINTFNMSGEEMGHVADVIAGAANNSAIDVNDFRLSTAAAGAAVALAGGSFDDMAVAITAMGQAGIKGSDAGTSLKTMLLNLQPTTKAQTTLFKELGLVTADGSNKFFDAQGKLRSFADVAGVLQDALKGQTDQQKLSTLETIFGSDAIRAAAVFAEQGSEGFNTLGEAIGRQGSAAEAGRTRLDNLSGDITKLGGSVEVAAIKFGQAFQPAVRAAVQALDGFISDTIIPFAEQLGPPLADAAVKVGQGMARFAEAATSTVAQALDGIVAKLAETGPKWAEWASKSGAAGEAVGKGLQAASGAVLALRFLIDGNLPAAAATAKTAFDDMGGAAESAGKAVDGLRQDIEKLSSTRALLGDLSVMGDSLARSFENLGGAADIMLPKIFGLGAAGAEAGEKFNVFSFLIHAALGPVLSLMQGVENFTKAVLVSAQATDIIGGAIGALTGQLGPLFDAIGTAAHAVEETVVGALNNMQAGANAAITGLVAGVVSGLSSMVGGAASAIGEFASTVIGGLSSLAGSASAQAAAIGSSIVSGLVGGIQSRAGQVASAAASMVTNALNAARAAVGAESPATEFIDLGEDVDQGLIEGIEEGIPEAEAVAAELGESVIDAATDEIQSGTVELEQAGIDMGQAVMDGIAAGLGSVKMVEGAADDLKGTVAGAMRDLAGEVDKLNAETNRKFGEVGSKAGRAIRDAIGDADRQIASTIADTATRIAELQANLAESRLLRGVREAFGGRQSAAADERSRVRQIEDIQRDRRREDAEAERELAQEIAKAKTAEEVAGILERYQESRDDLLQRRKLEDEDRDYARKREEEDRTFKKQQDQELRAFEDGLDDEALKKSIARAEEDRDERIRTITETLEEKQRKIDEDARDEQRKLVDTTRERIQTLKDEFLAKLPALTEQASAIVTTFLSGIDQAIQRTMDLARNAGAAIAAVGSGGGGGGGGGNNKAVGQFTVPLEGGGSMTVNASDLAAAIENVQVQGGTPAGAPEQPQNAFGPTAIDDPYGRSYAHGGVVPGPPGQPHWSVVHGGETVLPADYASRSGNGVGSGATMHLIVEIDGRAFASAIAPYTEGRVVLRAI